MVLKILKSFNFCVMLSTFIQVFLFHAAYVSMCCTFVRIRRINAYACHCVVHLCRSFVSQKHQSMGAVVI